MHTSPQCIDLLDFLDSPARDLEMYAFTTTLPGNEMYRLISRAISDITEGVDETEMTKLTGIVDRVLAGNPRLCDLHKMPTTLQ
jgi:hypothetical protein